jgi:flagellar biosynthesis protein FlhA
MAMNSGYVEEEIDGIETVEPFMGLPALWISESQRERAEALGYTVVDAPAIIATHLTEIVRSHLHELLSRQDVQRLIDNVKEHNPILVDELIPKLMSIGEVQKVLSKLLKEGISIRDLVTILETLADYAPVTRDTDMLTEYVRQRLRRTITRQYVSGNVLKVVTIDQDVEQTILNSIKKGEHGTYMALEPEKVQRIVGNVIEDINAIKDIVSVPVVLTSPIVRVYLKKMLDQFNPNITVLSFSEIDPTVQIQALANVQM